MLCERCQKRPAQVHFTQIINNSKKEINLCPNCASEMQAESLGFAPQLNLHDFLAGLINHHLAGANINQVNQNTLTQMRCEKCGASESQVSKNGLFGCSDCYAQFDDRVKPILKRIHGSSIHTGKVPRRTGGKAQISKEIRLLKAQLHEVIKQEEFEQAAKIRDQIKELEQRML